MITPKKPLRTLGQQVTNQGFTKPSLYSVSGLINFGSESNANFVDVVSVGPITSIDKIYINDTDIETGEFPLSEFYPHTGETETTPFEGNFPYVERAYSINKQADLVEGDDDTSTKTVFKRSVSGVGVAGVRISFTAPQFTHKDNKNRRKRAQAIFKLHLLDENGTRVKTETADTPYFYSSDPISVQITVLARDQDLQRVWDYEVEMDILNNYYRTVVTGNWTASIATELYKDTQTYKDVAMVSGKVVSSDVSGSTPKREYLVKGYKVDVPIYSEPNQTFLGQFKKETSNSHAWNAMAVMVDEKWGAGLHLDKINIADFVEFDKYVSEILPDGSQRYKHSQELLKADNYFRIASQIVGAADGKLYEDTSGRIGVLIDRQTDKRRVITSYDIQNEKVKRTTVPDKKKTNYVEMEFSDETNNYQKNIISVQDDAAMVRNGLISEKLKSDTCTNPSEALRTIKKVLANSQIATSTYVFSVGHTHEDVQIGEVVALYDRIYSRVNYCGKIAAGTTLTKIIVDKRTPISLEGISNPYLVLDNDRGVPARYPISSWTDHSVTLSTPLQTVPEDFTSFAVESNDVDGLKPTLMRVMGVTDNKGVLQLECLEYNDSLQSYVENGTELVIPLTRIIPELQEEIQGLSLIKTTAGISANWDDAEEGAYVYFWKKFTGDTERDPNNTGILVTSGQTGVSNNTLPIPLEPARYEFSVYILNESTGESSSTKSVSINLDITDSATSSIPQPTNFDTEEGQGSYAGRGFTLKWDQVVGNETPYLMGYILRITQGGSTLEYRLSSDYRSYQITPQELTEAFGEDYSRSFTARLIAYDDTLASAPTVTRVINNDASISPEITVRVTGDILLSSNSGVPEDAIGSLVYVWESSDVNSARPATALVFRSNQVAEIDLPNDTLVYDNRDYVFEAAWIDGFGEIGANYGRSQIAFGPDVLIPEAMYLIRANAYSITGIQVEFEHDGVWLEKMKVYYRKTNESGEFLLDDSYLFEGDVRVNYDEDSQSGTFIIEGLDYNSEYEIYTTVSNTASADSESSGTVIGLVIPYADVTDIRNDLNDAVDDIIANKNEIDGTIKPNLQLETLKRESSDKELFNTTAALAQFRRESNKDLNKLTDATFEVNPENGEIQLRAFNYADDQFTQAGILIDGVDARVNINASKIVDLDGSIINTNASIDVLAGEVAIKASYTEMTEYVAGAIDAILPAYSFGFFNSAEGWSAVNGTLTQGNSLISVTWGDIENQMLSYPADENPVITITCERTAGSGYTGDLIVTFSGGGTKTYSGVIDDVVMGVVNTKTLNLAEESTYTGTVTGLRLVLGDSVADTYDISSITIGKPSAQLDALDGITAQVNQLGIDVDAIEGQLTSFVTTTFYDQNTVTLNNVTQVLDGEDAIISLKATQQELGSSGTITKANSAATWIDGSAATIRNSVVSFNAETGSIDDQIAGITGGLNSVQQEVSAIDGAKIRSNLISINRLETESKDLAELQFYSELKLLEQRNKDLELGDSVATVDAQLKAVSDEQGAQAQEILELTASTGVLGGQINANSTRIQNAETSTNGIARALAALTTDVENTQGDLSSAELLLDSTVDDLGVVSSRAFLGVSDTVDGKTTVTGITADSSTNGLRFQGDKIQFDDTAGNPALFYNATRGKWTLNGDLVVGGYSVNSEDDIRALDGDTIYEIYQYSVNGSTNWHDNYTTGDIYRRTSTVTNGVQGAWSAAARITGLDGETGPQGVAGQNGSAGAGFYGATYSAITWTTSTANSRFSTLVGRNPVNGDIFTQTRVDGTDSQARQYNGSSWVTVALQVNGSIVAKDTIAGDRLIAGTEISAPVITGGVITGGTINGGTINGVDGNFTGTIYAQNIEGDVTASRVKVAAQKSFPPNTTPSTFISFNIAPAAFERTVVIHPIAFIMEIFNQEPITHILRIGISFSEGGQFEDAFESSQTRDQNTYKDVTSKPLSATIPQNVSRTVYVQFQRVGGNVNTRGFARQQSVLCQVFKQGGSIS